MKRSTINKIDNQIDANINKEFTIEDELIECHRQIRRLSMKCDVLEKEVKYLLNNFSKRRSELDSLYEEHQNLINSRGYRLLEKSRKVKRVITGEKLWKRKK